MDLTQSTDFLLNSHHPAYLIVGSPEATLEHTITQLQYFFCKSNGCSICFICRKIQEQQHETVQWLCPEKHYTIDDLKNIFSTISFALEENQHYFFVLQKADQLTNVCANALLKSLEEPPPGYHFILLAQRTEFVLPTIKSRCLIHQLSPKKDTMPLASLMPFFTTTHFHDPLAFSKELENNNPSEWQTLALLDQLLLHWIDVYKQSISDNQAAKAQQAQRMINHLKKALVQTPMPGGVKLFWKNLFLQIKEVEAHHER